MTKTTKITMVMAAMIVMLAFATLANAGGAKRWVESDVRIARQTMTGMVNDFGEDFVNNPNVPKFRIVRMQTNARRAVKSLRWLSHMGPSHWDQMWIDKKLEEWVPKKAYVDQMNAGNAPE